MLRHPCILGDPQQRGTKSEVAAAPVPSRGPKTMRKSKVTPAFSGIPNKGGKTSQVAASPYDLRGPKKSANDSSPMHSRGSSTPSAQSKIGGGPRQRINKRRSGCLTPAFSLAQKRAEMLHHPDILGDPKQRGTKSEVLPHPSLLGGHNRAEVLRHPCILGIKSEVVASPLPSPGRQKRAEMRRHPCILGDPKKKKTKTRSGCLTLAFSGAQKRAEVLRHPCILGGPQRRARSSAGSGIPNKGEQNQKWLPHQCLLGGLKHGGNARSPLRSWGSPIKGKYIKSGCLPLPSREPKKGRKCYITPAFSGFPTPSAGSKIKSGP